MLTVYQELKRRAIEANSLEEFSLIPMIAFNEYIMNSNLTHNEYHKILRIIQNKVIDLSMNISFRLKRNTS